MCSILRGQNTQLVLTIPDGSALAVKPTVHTTSHKVDTPSAEVPKAQALAARPRSKVMDGNPTDDDPDLLNFDAVGF
jgi:hypothetical protein